MNKQITIQVRNATWHAEYLRLENAENAAREEYRVARRSLDRKRQDKHEAQMHYDAALEAFRAAGKARWDFEMAATQIVDVATFPAREFFAALR